MTKITEMFITKLPQTGWQRFLKLIDILIFPCLKSARNGGSFSRVIIIFIGREGMRHGL